MGSPKMNFGVVAVLVFLVGRAEALQDSVVCYILDGILFFYGILLTVLYCRLKFLHRKKTRPRTSSVIYEKVEGMYMGLEAQEMQPYSTLEASKKPPEALPPRKTPTQEGLPTEEGLPTTSG